MAPVIINQVNGNSHNETAQLAVAMFLGLSTFGLSNSLSTVEAIFRITPSLPNAEAQSFHTLSLAKKKGKVACN